MRLHVKIIYCTIKHVKVLHYIQISRRTEDLKHDTISEYLIQEYSMNLLVALLFITVMSPCSSADYRSFEDGANILLLAM